MAHMPQLVHRGSLLELNQFDNQFTRAYSELALLEGPTAKIQCPGEIAMLTILSSILPSLPFICQPCHSNVFLISPIHGTCHICYVSVVQ